MDAVKFVKEYLRMCTNVDECEDCPVYKTDFCAVPAKERSQESAEKIVELVEEWSAAHPRKTRQSVFLEQYPNARVNINTGLLNVYPCAIEQGMENTFYCGSISCADCRRKFWMQEVE